MAEHFRKDSKNGITAPNLDAEKDVVQHITKHRGMKTPFTSVSEDCSAITHFTGVLYKVESVAISGDGHRFKSHGDLISQLHGLRGAARRQERIVVDRAIMLAKRAKEALVEWEFDLSSIERKDHISFCHKQIQKYFSKV